MDATPSFNPIDCGAERFAADCPIRLVFDQIADKWSIMVLVTLQPGPCRFNAIKRRLEGVTQKALTQSLRRLERNGLVTRRVLAGSPVAVEYELAALGREVLPALLEFYGCLKAHIHEIEAAWRAFDARQAA